MRWLFSSFLLIILSFVLFFPSEGKSSEDPQPEGILDTGKRWAFCVGVGHYSDPAINDLLSPSECGLVPAGYGARCEGAAGGP